MRVRVLCVLCTTLAALLWVVAPAQAATPLSASITCDPVSGVISTRLLGDLVPDFSYKIEFRTRNGSEVSNTGVERAIPGSGVLATVPVTTGPTGFVDIAGYSKQWRASDFRFYTETVRVGIRRASDNVEVMHRTATCTYDTRTELTLTCDEQAGVVAARSRASGFAPNRALRVDYFVTSVHQASPGSPRFKSGPYLYESADVTTAADGTFDVVGWEESFTDDPYYLEYQVTAEVKETKLLMVVGRSEAHCLYASGAE